MLGRSLKSCVSIGILLLISSVAPHVGADGPVLGPFQEDRLGSSVLETGPLLYSTFIGGDLNEIVTCVHLDKQGNVYFAGYTYSTNFTTTEGAFQRIATGGADVFVCKISTNGSLVFSTLVGGNGTEYANCISVDDTGHVYVGGHTRSEDFPIINAYQSTRGGGLFDAFLFKLSSNGSSLFYSTFLGGSGRDSIEDIVLDDGDRVVVTGSTNSTEFPTTPGAFKENLTTGDAFVTKFDADGGSLIFSTLIGSDVYGEGGLAVALAPDGAVIVSGSTYGAVFPTTPGAIQNGSDVNYDSIFVAKVISNGTDLEFATCLGTKSRDSLADICVDGQGYIYLTGDTDSSNFPTTPGAYNRTGALGQDVFITKMSPNGSSLEYSTYIPGGFMTSNGIYVDDNGNAYIAGNTRFEPVATTAYAYQTRIVGENDVFVQKLSPDGSSLVYGSMLGGSSHDSSFDCAVDRNGTFYIVGVTYSNNFPTTDDALFPERISVQSDGYFFKFRSDYVPPTADAGRSIETNQSEVVTFDGSASRDDVRIWDWTWTFKHAGKNVTLTGPRPTYSFSQKGMFTVTLNVTDGAGNWATDEMYVIVHDNVPPVAEAQKSITVNPGEDVVFDGTKSTDNVMVVNWTWNFTYRGSNLTLHGARARFVFQDLGRYIVNLTVKDADGNSDTTTVTVLVQDSISPSIVEDLSDVQVSTGEEVWFRVNVTDNVGVARTEVVVDGETITMGARELFGDGKGVYVYKMRVAKDRSEPIVYRFLVTDTSGNVGTGPSRSVTVVDTTPPSVDFETRSSPVKGLDYTFMLYALDNVGIESVTFEYWFTGGDHRMMTPTFHPGSIEQWMPYYEGRIPIPRDAVGRFYFIIEVVDLSGNNVTSDLDHRELVNYPPTLWKPGYWNVTEESEESLDLAPYIEDQNDPLESLTLEVLSGNAWLNGFVLFVHYSAWVPDDIIRLRLADGEDVVLVNVSVRMTNVNDVPNIIRVEPDTGSEFYEGTPIPFRAFVEDEDHDQLTITWRRGIEVLHVGEVYNTSELGRGRHIITVFVSDGQVELSHEVEVIVLGNPGEQEEPVIDVFGLWVWASLAAIFASMLIVWVLVRASKRE